MESSRQITIAVLAGGNGLRLGRNKIFELLEKENLLQTVITRLNKICQPIIIVTSQRQYDLICNLELNQRIVIDRIAHMGVMGAVYTALLNSASYHIFVTGVDMPFLNISLIEHQIDICSSFDAVVPQLNGLNEPLHSIYSKNCISYLEILLNKGTLKMSALFRMIKVKHIFEDEINHYDPEYLSFFNINTVDDLTTARMIAKTDLPYINKIKSANKL